MQNDPVCDCWNKYCIRNNKHLGCLEKVLVKYWQYPPPNLNMRLHF